MIDTSQTKKASVPALVSEVQAYYGIGPRFAQAYLDYWHLGFEHTFEHLTQIRKLPPPASVWFDFALTANSRGEQTARLVAPHIPQEARRYLDIGCGYAGSMVAFSKLGLEVIGIDINHQLLDLARANCLDHNLQDCVFYADILEHGLVERLGKFDIITLLAVIEHVEDVPQTLKNAVSLLAPGGILVLDIPNKYSLTFVAHDPHYNLFGLTLLERPLAIEYFQDFFTLDYDVGDFYELEYYQSLLQNQGCTSELILSPQNRPGRLLTFPLRALSTFTGYLRYQRHTKPRLTESLAAQVKKHFHHYLAELRRDLFRQSWRADDLNSFQLKYLTSVWMLKATAPPA
jgi:SAM-dependent methyltransferase